MDSQLHIFINLMVKMVEVLCYYNLSLRLKIIMWLSEIIRIIYCICVHHICALNNSLNYIWVGLVLSCSIFYCVLLTCKWKYKRLTCPLVIGFQRVSTIKNLKFQFPSYSVYLDIFISVISS